MVYEVFRHHEVKRYKAAACSSAMVIQVIITSLTIILPLIIAYKTYGFYPHESSYQEKPFISYKNIAIILLQTSKGIVSWSTMPKFNALQSSPSKQPPLLSYSYQWNEYFNIEIDFPTLAGQQIYGAQIILFFDYYLYRMINLKMEAMAVIQHSAQLPGKGFTITGDLKLRQRYPFYYHGSNIHHLVSIVDSSSTKASEYEIASILKRYAKRNVSAEFTNSYPIWKTGNTEGKPFKINATINYIAPTVIYTPGFWYIIKWAWIQYVSIAVVFFLFFDKLKYYIFQNQVVASCFQLPPCICVESKISY